MLDPQTRAGSPEGRAHRRPGLGVEEIPDDIWSSFATAGFTCWSPAPLTVRPAPTGQRAGPFPFACSATFVTADNPGGRKVPDDVNAAGRAELARFLDTSALVWHPAVGGDPDGDHHEPGVIVLGLGLGAAAELGRLFRQAAVYVWERDALHLMACSSDRHDLFGYLATAGTTLRPPALGPCGTVPPTG